jgi:pyruvate/2-oxoglutarate dehydrogenase complex dihydrolipoamide acyltransferase (E2) component
MPKLAMAMNEGTVVEWLVDDCTFVESAQPLAAIETEKVAYDVESPEAGYFKHVIPEGETVDCDVIIGVFADAPEELSDFDLEQLQASADPGSEDLPVQGQLEEAKPSSSSERIKISPVAKKMAKESGVDPSSIAGSGPGQRVVKRDVEAAIAATRQAGLPAGAVLARVNLSGLRGQIAHHMQQSLSEGAQLTANWESDVTEMLALRDAVPAVDGQGRRISVNSLLIRAMVEAIREVPMANACIEASEIVLYRSVNVGIAISVAGESAYDSGLKVGVLHGADTCSLTEIDQQMKALIDRVRGDRTEPGDLSGSTVTLSSTAGIGPPGLMSTPVLNSPNVALLGPSTPIERPMVVDSEIVARTMMPLSFTFDHRALDGEPAARFMRKLHDLLESPAVLFN